MNTSGKYKETLEKLLRVDRKKGIKMGLQNVRDLNRLLGGPAERLTTIHVAGTNGKGSVANYVARGAREKFSKVGLYTSPHISSFRERITINDRMISKKEVVGLMEQIFGIADKFCPQATFFELTTMLAFKYFADNSVDLAVIETGLGGRLDATNIITPILSIITTIGLDHQKILGNTLEKIAGEKAGIIKDGVPVVIGPQATAHITPDNAPYIRVTGRFGNFYDENRATAGEALKLLGIGHRAIENALKIKIPCRLQIIPFKNRKFYLDAAHNPQALKALFRSLPQGKKYQAICAFGREKELTECLKEVCDNTLLIRVIKELHPRLTDWRTIVKNLKSLNADHTIHESLKDAVKSAGEYQEYDCVITGTFYIMEPALKQIKKDNNYDS